MKYKSGQTVPDSGIYKELSATGTWITDVTCVKEEPFPPTETGGYHYEIKYKARHKVKG